MTRFLHVANGTCTTQLIEAAGLPGRTSLWADPLDEGPVPSGLSDDALLEVRAGHLGTDEAPRNALRAWRAAIAHHDAFDELILWFEHDLFDQLNLIQLLDWLPTVLPAAVPVRLVSIDAYPGRTQFRGLGELTPREIAGLFDVKVPIAEVHYAGARQMWLAFREATPERLSELSRLPQPALPFLAPAIRRLLEELPWTTDGLSRTERRLLDLASRGPLTLAEALPEVHRGESCYYATDRTIAALAGSLASTSPPLLRVVRPSAAGADDCPIALQLTGDGRAVLEGRTDRVSAFGIDRWLGGVHLHGRHGVWRWDAHHAEVRYL